MKNDSEIRKVAVLLEQCRETADWNYRLDKRIGNSDSADRWSATLGHIENAIARLSA
jgi:hypothetical protein